MNNKEMENVVVEEVKVVEPEVTDLAELDYGELSLVDSDEEISGKRLGIVIAGCTVVATAAGIVIYKTVKGSKKLVGVFKDVKDFFKKKKEGYTVVYLSKEQVAQAEAEVDATFVDEEIIDDLDNENDQEPVAPQEKETEGKK